MDCNIVIRNNGVVSLLNITFFILYFTVSNSVFYNNGSYIIQYEYKYLQYSEYYLLGLEVEVRIYKEPEYNIANINEKYNNSVSITVMYYY